MTNATQPQIHSSRRGSCVEPIRYSERNREQANRSRKRCIAVPFRFCYFHSLQLGKRRLFASLSAGGSSQQWVSGAPLLAVSEPVGVCVCVCGRCRMIDATVLQIQNLFDTANEAMGRGGGNEKERQLHWVAGKRRRPQGALLQQHSNECMGRFYVFLPSICLPSEHTHTHTWRFVVTSCVCVCVFG